MKEREYIQDLAAQADAAGVIQGIGDDCAVLRLGKGRVQLASMDTLVETIHFDRRFHPPELLGRKVVSVNVSDIAAMGGIPKMLLLSSGLPPGFDEDWVRAFNRGFLTACTEYGCALVGGDTVASPGGFSFTVTVLGEMAEKDLLLRSSAEPGDAVYASGQLGAAAAGLALLQAGQDQDDPDFAPLFARHLNPSARVELGQKLATSGLVHAMMDCSDGPATDLAHLCAASGLGAVLFAENFKPSAALAEAARLCGAQALDWMLKGGEDFELLFTAAPDQEASLRELAAACGLPLLCLGRMDREPGLRLSTGGQESPLGFQGYNHFQED